MRGPAKAPLHGRRVLLVEDEALILMLIEEMLFDLGASSVRTATSVDEAERVARDAAVDLAVLDVNLSGRRSYPAAAVLRARGVPILFATGYGPHGHESEWRSTPTLAKPFTEEELARALEAAMAA